MKVILLLLVYFADGTPPLSAKFLIAGGPTLCATALRGFTSDPPKAVFGGHPVAAWSVSCVVSATQEKS